MKRKKILIVFGILLVIAIVVIPVRPKYGDRPVVSHGQWQQDAAEVADLLSAYDDREWEADTKMIQLNVDQLTGLNGYSILGVEGFFGHRTTSVVGYIKEQDATNFYREQDIIWIGSEDIPKLRKLTSGS